LAGVGEQQVGDDLDFADFVAAVSACGLSVQDWYLLPGQAS
jgi:hypothetical protein